MSFTNQETLCFVRRKLTALGLPSDENRDIYGSMHILGSDYQGMQAYMKAYKCDNKQGVIANLTAGLHRACHYLEDLGLDSSEFRATLEAADAILKRAAPMSEGKGD